MSHTGYFTLTDLTEVQGTDTRISQSSEHCSQIRCDCGWTRETTTLREAKGLLAVHQHEALDAL